MSRDRAYESIETEGDWLDEALIEEGLVSNPYKGHPTPHDFLNEPGNDWDDWERSKWDEDREIKK